MQQSLFKQFAEILDFTLKFDDLKVSFTSFSFKKSLLCPVSGVSIVAVYVCIIYKKDKVQKLKCI